MKNALLAFFQRIEPAFKKGGKLEKFYPAYEAFYTFVFRPVIPTSSPPHIRDGVDLKRTMTAVIISLIPCTLFGIWNIGHQHYISIGQHTGISEAFFAKFLYGLKVFLPILIVSYVTGLAVEFTFSVVRGHPVSEGFLVTGLLIPLVMPPTIPLWTVAVATIAGIIFGKEVFGGTGYNVVNPALFVRAIIFFGYPAYITGNVWVETGGLKTVDGFTGATPLAILKQAESSNVQLLDPWTLFIGTIPGSIGETSKLMCLIGAILLIIWQVADLSIILSALAGTAVFGIIANYLGSSPITQIPFYYHYLIGGYAFGITFMATDPVSAAKTPTGKIIYGAAIGILIPLLRIVNPAYPEVTMLVILFCNGLSSLIDVSILAINKRRRMKRWQTAKKPEPLLSIEQMHKVE